MDIYPIRLPSWLARRGRKWSEEGRLAEGVREAMLEKVAREDAGLDTGRCACNDKS